MSHNLESAILKTILYFDIFRYPLTEREVWKWLWKCEAHLPEVRHALGRLVKKNKIATKDGLYFIRGSNDFVAERREKYLVADKKYKKLKRIITVLQFVPFIRFVGACNTMHILDFKESSDLDVFIIVEKGRMWTARLLTTIVVGVLGQWRHGSHIKDKVCLSFYVTTAALDLKKIALKEDPYLVYWITFVVPLLDRGVYEAFWKKNDWILKYLPQAQKIQSIGKFRSIHHFHFLENIRYIFERILAKKIGRKVERFLRKIQIQKMKAKEAQPGREKSSIVITDTMLKFHEVDRKKAYRNSWKKNIELFIKNHA